MRIFTSVQELTAAAGTDLGRSGWLEITQDRVDAFAEATGDHQWIHVDAARAAHGPFGRTIAHGWLTASLLPVLSQQIYRVEARMGVNYGSNRIRYPAPVPVGSLVRASSVLHALDEVGDAVQLTVRTEIRAQDADRPALVAETVSRYYL